jgi:multiple sugar transport system permease protein
MGRYPAPAGCGGGSAVSTIEPATSNETGTIGSPVSEVTVKRRGRWAGLAFSLPGVLLLAAFLAAPFLLAVVLSFTSERLASPLPTRFVGLDNYVATFGSSSFRQALGNNIYFTAVVVPLQTALALGLAMLVNQKLRGVKVYRAIYFSPVVVVMTVAATVWLLLYSPDRGLLNGILSFISFGTLQSDWLRSELMAMPSIMIMSIWQGVGFQMIIILAGLQEIPEELYEAAAIDGASPWQRFLFVTIPQLRNTLIFVGTVTMILAFRLFDQVWVMTRGSPLGRTNVMMLEMVNVGFEQQQIARGSAIAVIFFLIVLTLTIIQRRFIKEEVN